VKRHFQNFVNARNVDIVYETVAEDFLDHDGPGGGLQRPGHKSGVLTRRHARIQATPQARRSWCGMTSACFWALHSSNRRRRAARRGDGARGSQWGTRNRPQARARPR
jgi:hypothetical protein